MYSVSYPWFNRPTLMLIIVILMMMNLQSSRIVVVESFSFVAVHPSSNIGIRKEDGRYPVISRRGSGERWMAIGRRHHHRRRIPSENNGSWCLWAGQGFGPGAGKDPKIRPVNVKRGGSTGSRRTKTTPTPDPSASSSTLLPPLSVPQHRPYVKAEHNVWLEQLTDRASHTELGRMVAQYNSQEDPFWDLLPPLIASKFPTATDRDLHRITGLIQHVLSVVPKTTTDERPKDWVNVPHRPYEELHTYMPGLPTATPFVDPMTLPVCQQLSDHYDIIRDEYQALVDHLSHDHFQSVTSMNYDSGWSTLVLFSNGHRLPKFPYHKCPTTTRLLESLPLAGRIAGFNRQAPNSGIPLHTDGNNMWLTLQMGIHVPPTAYITVANETRHWQPGQCLVYDTTFQHETFNPDLNRERIVLHVDFFNTLVLTEMEIAVLQYIYKLREDFMTAEGVGATVGAQWL
jgi:ornithine lipid ester-linked acyl 2-hydroxylase